MVEHGQVVAFVSPPYGELEERAEVRFGGELFTVILDGAGIDVWVEDGFTSLSDSRWKTALDLSETVQAVAGEDHPGVGLMEAFEKLGWKEFA